MQANPHIRMDIKFHITKIIESGSNAEDWIVFIDQLKQNKCDRDLLTQIYTVALNNISNKKTKIYKKLLIGLANLQSETSPDLARTTFLNANSLDSDCAVVCVYHAQFEYKQQKRNAAIQILKCGKCDGRSPKVIIKKAYINLRQNKSSLFDGVLDPWDESWQDMSDTITNTQSPTNMGLKLPHVTRSTTKLTKSLGMPTRLSGKTHSASSVLKESKVKSPTEELGENFGLILGDKIEEIKDEIKAKKRNDSGIFVAPASVKALPDKENKSYGPSLSPFMNGFASPLVKNRTLSFTGSTPGVFLFDMIKSNEKDKPIVSRTVTKRFSELFTDTDETFRRGDVTSDDGYMSANTSNISNKTQNLTAVENSRFSLQADEKKNTLKRSLGVSLLQEKIAIPEPANSGLTQLIDDIDLGCKPLEEKDVGLVVQNETDQAKNNVKPVLPLNVQKHRKPLSLLSETPMRKADNTNCDLFSSAKKSSGNRIPLSELRTVSSKRTEVAVVSSDSKDTPELSNTKSVGKLLAKDIATPGVETKKKKLNRIPLNEVKDQGLQVKPVSDKSKDINTENNEKLLQTSKKKSISESTSKNTTLKETLPKEKNKEPVALHNLQSMKIPENLPSTKKDVDSLLQSGLHMLGQNGFDMNKNLRHIPSETKSKIFMVNGVAYQQIKCIGKGGSCKVYEVVDSSGRVYALKKVKLEDVDQFMISCYIQEIKLLEQLKGKSHIIELYGWEKTAEFLLIVLEIGSRDLANVLRQSKELSPETLKHYWKQMLLAVSVVHEQGVVHADLKPANFLFVGSVLKLIDFGIADNIQANKTSVTREYQMGTLNYMSPEALMSDVSHEFGASKISRASDVWSLGCMLYLMVFKRTPYQHIKNQSMKIFAIQKGEAINMQGINDQSLYDCLQGCLKYNKRERYTIQQLLAHPFLR
ncbi:dual specificity protein kinase TTK-like [Hydractinia symbiolongicarpus]|uniref:dual specificity protein kinase TTK-like n=1 Tax=Hydractinia symbiolongicarpus TaxID=13093 RepID=UPI00254DA36B|nr:dual specificity protein kinase TTK-like [Hydractinia symbiolongicarpus]